jgi:hypothetical protein
MLNFLIQTLYNKAVVVFFNKNNQGIWSVSKQLLSMTQNRIYFLIIIK